MNHIKRTKLSIEQHSKKIGNFTWQLFINARCTIILTDNQQQSDRKETRPQS